MRAVLPVSALAAAAALAASGAEFFELAQEYVFPHDLGPATIQVSAYPRLRAAQYRQFQRGCMRCHTLARAINAPFVTRKQWRPYVERMHWFSRQDPGEAITDAEAAAILDFLVFDSVERKIKRKDEFAALRRSLARQFDALRREKGLGAPDLRP
jgi:hypothetical protein